MAPSRRLFLSQSAAVGAAASLGDFGFLGGLPALGAADVQVQPAVVQLSPDIESLVRWLEETPRERIIEGLGQRIRTGTSYQELLTALMLAGVRSIKPRPVGFQFHTVLVVNSAHLASIAAQDRDRWLPLFWAFDNFKTSQARHRQVNGNWQLAAPAESRLPAPAQALRRFSEAMDSWDEDGADVAVTALARTAGAHEIFEQFWRYGCRDFRDIGHKAIFAANAYRTLHTIGWRHAEPILRSLAFALLEHEGENPARRDAEQDRSWRENLRRAPRIRAAWQAGRATPTAATELLAALRTGSPAEVSELVVTLLNREVAPASVWDGLFLTAGELLMRQPGIVGVHCVTSVNALHFAYTTSSSDETRRMLLLQAAAFLAHFRMAMRQRGQLRDDLRLDTLEPERLTTARGPGAVEEVLSTISTDKVAAARKLLTLVRSDPAMAEALLAGARRLIFTKGRDSHDYKFSAAALEDFYHATPHWRERLLAASVFYLRGTGDRDNELIQQARTALGRA